LIVQIDEDNTLYFSKLYPYYREEKSLKLYKSLLGIGGNIGNVKRRFNHLFIALKKSPYIDIIETAPILKNPPFGYLEQSDFHNSLIYVKTCLKPKALLRYILRLEKKFSRRRSFQDAPRTLDIDIIFYEDLNITTKDLTIPHPSWAKRASVTTPMSYMKSLYIKNIYLKKKGKK
jgi:2-amino-4-hydroxy-6-hydroxymethyldihydropteridine diphosphokinase